MREKIHLSIIIINKKLYFKFVQSTMYIIFIINHVYNLTNESKMFIFYYNSK